MSVLTTAFAMWVSVLFFASWLKPATKRKVVGAGLWADITVHVVLQGMFGGDAQGRAGLLLAGVLINLTMHTYRKYAGWETLSFEGWKRFDGQGNDITPVVVEEEVTST